MCKWIALTIILSIVIPLIVVDDFRQTVVKGIDSALAGPADEQRLLPIYTEIRKNYPLKGKNCVVTGSSRGLGHGIASELVALGCQTVLAQRSVRNVNTSAEVMEAARSVAPSTGSDSLLGSTMLVALDLSNMTSIEQFVQSLRRQQITLDVLVLNAAVIVIDNELTADGFELTWGTNHVGHFYLLQLLMDNHIIPSSSSKSNGDCVRIITVISELHRISEPINMQTFGRDQREITLFTALRQYGYTKLCNIMAAVELARRNHNLCMHIYDPGPVASDIARNVPFLATPAKLLMERFFRSPLDCAKPVGYMATDASFAHQSRDSIVTPRYMVLWHENKARDDCYNETLTKFVYDTTQELIEEKLKHRIEMKSSSKN